MVITGRHTHQHAVKNVLFVRFLRDKTFSSIGRMWIIQMDSTVSFAMNRGIAELKRPSNNFPATATTKQARPKHTCFGRVTLPTGYEENRTALSQNRNPTSKTTEGIWEIGKFVASRMLSRDFI